MAVNLSPLGGVGAQFFDNSGNPLTGGKIYTYAAGTTTPQTTYTTSAGGIPHTNPIILDAAGRVPGGEIWLTDGSQYKFVLKTSTETSIATYDNVIGINSNFVNYTNQQEIQTATAGQTVFTLTTVQYQVGTNSLSVFVDGVNQYGPGAQYAYTETDSTTVTFNSGLHVGAEVKFTTSQLNTSGAIDASQVSYDPPITGSVPTNVESKLSEYISVLDFGADPTGVADSTTALQTALTECTAQGKTVFIPSGTYKFSTLTFPDYDCYVVGENSSSTILTTNTTADAITVSRAKSGISNIKLVQSDATQAGGLPVTYFGKGIVCYNAAAGGGCDLFSCENVVVEGFQYNIYADKSVWLEFKNCTFSYGEYGAYFEVRDNAPNNTWFNNAVLFQSVRFNRNASIGVLWGGLTAFFNNCETSLCPTGFYIKGGNPLAQANVSTSGGVSIQNCYTEANDDFNVVVDNAIVSIEDNMFVGADNPAPPPTVVCIQVKGNFPIAYIKNNKSWGYYDKAIDIDTTACVGPYACEPKAFGSQPFNSMLATTFAPTDGSYSEAIFGTTKQTAGYATLGGKKFSVNAYASNTALSQRVEYNAAGNNFEPRAIVRDDSVTTNRTTTVPTLVLVNNATPTSNQMVRLAFAASSPGLPQNFNGLVSADIRVVFPTTGLNGRSSRLVFGTTDESTSQSPVDRFYVKETGSVVYIPLAAAPLSPTSGEVYYDSVMNKLRCYDGTSWNDLF